VAAHWGDVGTWAGSVGTVGALFAALFGLKREADRRRADEQAMIARAHRAHAELISAWPTGSPRSWGSGERLIRIGVLNGSSEPVYEVVIFLVDIQGGGAHSGEEWMASDDHARQARYRVVLGALPPGRWAVTLPMDGGWSAPQARPGAEISFTDRAGAHWLRRATGALQELKAKPLQHYGIGRPLDYQTAEREPD